MNVVQIVSHFDLGGAERIAINIAKSKESDINYHMIEVVRGSSNFSRDYMKELETAGIKYYRSPFTNSKMGIVFFPIRLIANHNKISIMYFIIFIFQLLLERLSSLSILLLLIY